MALHVPIPVLVEQQAQEQQMGRAIAVRLEGSHWEPWRWLARNASPNLPSQARQRILCCLVKCETIRLLRASLACSQVPSFERKALKVF